MKVYGIVREFTWGGEGYYHAIRVVETLELYSSRASAERALEELKKKDFHPEELSLRELPVND